MLTKGQRVKIEVEGVVEVTGYNYGYVRTDSGKLWSVDLNDPDITPIDPEEKP